MPLINLKRPEFWNKRSFVSTILNPLGWMYGYLNAHRMVRAAEYCAEIPVICVGNFTVGGNSKSPMVQSVIKILKGKNFNPVVLMRGYGGSEVGPLLLSHRNSTDPQWTAHQVGDEALMHQELCDVIISKNRAKGAAMAGRLGFDAIVMDDGLQNPTIEKTIKIAMLNTFTGLGNGQCFPAGPLRAPISVQIPFVDALVLITSLSAKASEKNEPAVEQVVKQALSLDIPVFHAKIIIDPNYVGDKSIPVLAIAGIAKPEQFAQTLEMAGFHIAKLIALGDHQSFDDAMAKSFLTLAKREHLQILTTSKDMARIKGQSGHLYTLSEMASEVPIVLEMDYQEKWEEWLLSKMRNSNKKDERASDE